MMKNKPPCKDCSERSARCHAEWEKYREFATANAEQRKQLHIENAGRQYTIEKYNKAVKKRKKRGSEGYERIKTIQRQFSKL